MLGFCQPAGGAGAERYRGEFSARSSPMRACSSASCRLSPRRWSPPGSRCIVGTALGWWLHAKRWAGLAFESWVASFAAAPLVLLYPLFLVFFGRNVGTIIVMSFLTALPSIVLKTKEGLDAIRRVLINVGRSFRLTPAQLFWKIMLPAAVPTLCTAVRLGLVYALISVVGIEFLINFGGLGEFIDDLAQRWEIPMMYGAISFVVLTSICFFYLTERLERWLRHV